MANNTRTEKQNTTNGVLDNSINNSQDNNPQNTQNNIVEISDNKGMKKNPVYKNLDMLTTEEARKRGRQGGIKSGEARKARKTLKQNILDLLTMELPDEKLDELGIDKSMLGGDNSLQNAITIAMLKESLNGDTKAFQLLRDTIDEAPTIKQEITETITQEDATLMNDLKKALIS